MRYYYEIRLPENETDTECAAIHDAYEENHRTDDTAIRSAVKAGHVFLRKFWDVPYVKVNCFETTGDHDTQRSVSTHTWCRGPLTVDLSHAPNPDVRGGYWQPTGVPNYDRVPVASYAEASRTCRKYIESHGLGGGNWTGGTLRRGGVIVGRVSYNGRVWDTEGNEIV